MIKCFLPNNIFSNICVLSQYFDMYISQSSCNSGTDLNTEDGPCIWILDEDVENGNCIPHSDFICNIKNMIFSVFILIMKNAKRTHRPLQWPVVIQNIMK
jgi:hypothetical protein